MANPFSVRPADVYQALLAGDESFDSARKQSRQTAQDAATREAGQLYASGDTRGALARLFAGNNPQMATAIANMDLARSNADWQKTYQGGMLDLARQKESREANEPKYIPGTDEYGNPTIQVVPRNQPPTTAPVGAAPGQMMPSYNGEQPRAAVPSTPKMVGDAEAVERGLYEQPTTVAQRAPQSGPQIPTPPPGVNRREWIKKFSTESAERAAAQPDAEKSVAESAGKLSQLRAAATAIKTNPSLWRAVGLMGVYNVPGTESANIEAAIDSLKAKVGFGALQAMRDASKTGGALGQVAVQELQKLENSISSLHWKQDPAQFRKSLQEIIEYANAAEKRIMNAFKATYPGAKLPDTAPPGSTQDNDPMGLR